MTLLVAVLVGWQLAMQPAHAGSAEKYQASYDLEARQNYQAALEQLEQLEDAGPDRYVRALRRGWLLYLLGRYADAAEAYRLAIRLNGESIEARQGLLLPLLASRSWTQAEAEARALLAVAPADYRGRSRLAYVLYSSGRHAAASKEYASVLLHYPADVEMRTGLGWALLKSGDIAGARDAFQAVLRVAPSHVSAAEGLSEAE
jgi:tetratricopeptide (TPR) repeat protein